MTPLTGGQRAVHTTNILADSGSCRLATHMVPGPSLKVTGSRQDSNRQAISHQTEVWTGVAAWEGDEPRSDDDETARVATSRCRSSTRFCSSALTASSSLRFW